MKYKELCETIYQDWRQNYKCFDQYKADFNINYLPEPYFVIKEGSKPLYVLNNNPGGVLDFQEHRNILKQFSSSTMYTDVAQYLTDQYTGENSLLKGSPAERRIKRIVDISEKLHLNGVENLETFFLHSKSFDKYKFLRKYTGQEQTTQYIDSLRRYLKNMPVLIVACVGSKESLSIKSIKKNSWLEFQAALIDLDLSTVNFRKITQKEDKITSGIFYRDNKYLLCCMGSNNIPNDASQVIATL